MFWFDLEEGSDGGGLGEGQWVVEGVLVCDGVVGYELRGRYGCRVDCKCDVASVNGFCVDWEEDCGCEGGGACLV